MGQEIPHQNGNNTGSGGGTPPPPSTGILLDPPSTVTINSSQTLTVYTAIVDSLDSRKYLVDIRTLTQKQSYEVLAKITNTNTVDFVIYAVVGQDISHNVNINVVGSDIIMSVENLTISSFDVDVRLIR